MNYQNVIKTLPEPLLVKVGNKYQPYEYIITNVTELKDTCLEIIEDRKAYYNPPEKPQTPDLTYKQTNELPNGTVKKAAEQQWTAYRQQLQLYQQEQLEWDMLQQALTGNTKAAFNFLSSRKHQEYENFEVLKPRKAKPSQRNTESKCNCPFPVGSTMRYGRCPVHGETSKPSTECEPDTESECTCPFPAGSTQISYRCPVHGHLRDDSDTNPS